VPLLPFENPFRVAHARRFTQMVFNIASYQRLLMDDFLRNGGSIHHRMFDNPRQFAGLSEHTVVNCTGYGARALIYRGHNLVMVPRRDGLLVQAQGEHDYGNTDMSIDRAQSEAAVQRLATLFKAS
jgi:hypothetical protein